MGLGDSLKKWAQSKATELLTADSQKREDASASAQAAQQQAKADVGETVLRTAFPQVGEWADRQEAARVAREQARDQQERDAVAALPLATVTLSVAGDYASGAWTGPLHLSWTETPDTPGVAVELFAGEADGPVFGELVMTRWRFEVPGGTGDGTYDLTAIAREREPLGVTYEEWAMDFADAADSSAYFDVGAGPSTVTVSDGGQRLTATLAMSGARGGLTATAEITRPAAG